MSICRYNDTLFRLVAPIEAYRVNVKVDRSSRHFSQNFNLRSKHGFPRVNVRQVPRDVATYLVVIEGHLISQSHMDEVLRSVVLIFLCENQ